MAEIVVLGGGSDIGKEIARHYSQEGFEVCLVSRSESQVNFECLQVIGDLSDPERINQIWSDICVAGTRECSRVYMCFGLLSSDGKTEYERIAELGTINFLAPSMWAVKLASIFGDNSENQKVIYLGSVASDRGRYSNFVYGASKKAVQVVFEGLDQEFSVKNVDFIYVKLGQVKTKMTKDFDRSGLFWSDSDRVAKTVIKRVERSGGGAFYAPRIWFFVMLIVKNIPTTLFRIMRF